jgi:hypothetical protein
MVLWLDVQEVDFRTQRSGAGTGPPFPISPRTAALFGGGISTGPGETTAEQDSASVCALNVIVRELVRLNQLDIYLGYWMQAHALVLAEATGDLAPVVVLDAGRWGWEQELLSLALFGAREVRVSPTLHPAFRDVASQLAQVRSRIKSLPEASRSEAEGYVQRLDDLVRRMSQAGLLLTGGDGVPDPAEWDEFVDELCALDAEAASLRDEIMERWYEEEGDDYGLEDLDVGYMEDDKWYYRYDIADWTDGLTWEGLDAEGQIRVVEAMETERLYPSSYVAALLAMRHPGTQPSAARALEDTELWREIVASQSSTD